MNPLCINRPFLGLFPELEPLEIEEGLAVEHESNELILPLYLTRNEAKTLLQMCATSTEIADEADEAVLFDKIAELLMTFHCIEQIENDTE